ncbi:GNAT family N-acetyltransferase [Roseitalea porphyridii]|uniref:N-acetyltransferase n=1 Tax=Roseitalea porphyridii TaxID=1852022 RepID=A0A4P6V3Z7_9HYPH|nr:GNAT family N-acetyltransferase [Roseitalea porphyridii]QBK31524.1 N-acetyltransferase [Roseitalea porphyridii]
MNAPAAAAPLTIRPAREADAVVLEAIAEQAYSRYVAAVGRRPAPMDTDFAARIGAGIVYVAARDEAVIGFAIFLARGDHMLLENIAVDPASSGQGVGGALITHCEAEARRLGLGAVELYANEKMTQNLSIYPHLGYREIGRREEDGFRRVFFRKELR